MKRQIPKFYPRAEGSSLLGIDLQKLYFKQLPQVIPIVKQFLSGLALYLDFRSLVGIFKLCLFHLRVAGDNKGRAITVNNMVSLPCQFIEFVFSKYESAFTFF